MKITTKVEYANLSQRGLLGNFLKSYTTLLDLHASGYEGFLTIRANDKQSPWFVSWVKTHGYKHQAAYGIMPVHDALFDIQDKGGPDDRAFYFQQVPSPSSVRKANIEAGYIDGRFVLYVETETTQVVRGIRERAQLLYGLTARMALKQAMSAQSIETLDELWERYPEAIIEATEFSRPCGELNQKLVVWEVRNF